VTVGAVGFVVLVVGFAMPNDEEQAPAQQHQRGGSHSVNLQAGRDIKLGDDKSGE
jgi:hypothetical protein